VLRACNISRLNRLDVRSHARSGFDGAPRRTRTAGHLFTKQVLYQLSYWGPQRRLNAQSVLVQSLPCLSKGWHICTMHPRTPRITERAYWPAILERLVEYAARDLAPTVASKEIAREFGCGERTVYDAMQRGEVPSYLSSDRARVRAWSEGRSRYLRSDPCVNCGGRVFRTSDGRCLPCDKAWVKKHDAQVKAELEKHRDTGDFFTGRGQSAEDRLFFGPKENLDRFRRGKKLHAMAAAMLEGATLDELSMITGWPPDGCSSVFYLYLREKGYGVERRAGLYYLLFPEGVAEIPLV